MIEKILKILGRKVCGSSIAGALCCSLILMSSVFLYIIPSSASAASIPVPPECVENGGYRHTVNCIQNAGNDPDVDDLVGDTNEDENHGDDDFETPCRFSSKNNGLPSSYNINDDDSDDNPSNWQFLCLAVPFFGQSIDWANTQIGEQIGLDLNGDENTSGGNIIDSFIDFDQINTIWSQNILPIANIILALVFLIIIYGVATGGTDGRGFISAYNIKKILPRLILAAVLINVSFYVCQIFNDLINIISVGIVNILQTNITGADAGGWVISNMMGNIADFIFDGSVSLGSMFGDSNFSTSVALLFCIMGIPILLSSIGLFVLLAIRELLVVVLIIASPIIFAVSLLPSQTNLASKYISIYVKLLLIYPAIVIIATLCFMIEQSAYSTFGTDKSFLPIVFIAVVSLVPFITIKPFYKAYTSLFSKISGQTKDIQIRMSAANSPKTPDGKSGGLLNNIQQRIRSATNNQSNTVSRQHSVKEKLEKEALTKNGTGQTPKPTAKTNSPADIRNTTINNGDQGPSPRAPQGAASSLTRARSTGTRDPYANTTINNVTNTNNTTQERRDSALPVFPNERLAQNERKAANPSLTLDRMDNKSILDTDGPAAMVANGAANDIKQPSNTIDKSQIAPDISHKRPTVDDNKESLASKLNKPTFAESPRPTKTDMTKQLDKFNQAATKPAEQANAQVGKDDEQTSPSIVPKDGDDLPGADAKNIETALNGPVVNQTADGTPLDDPKPKNIKDTLKSIIK